MGTVIYAANPLLAMLGSIGPLAFMFIFGISGIGLAIVRKNQGRGARIAMGIAGVFLMVIGLVLTVHTLLSISKGSQVVTVRVNDKSIAEANTNDNGTNTSYILESTAGLVSYDIVVPHAVYELAQVNACYQVEYFPGKSLFNSTPDTDLYHRIESVTRIEVADSSECP